MQNNSHSQPIQDQRAIPNNPLNNQAVIYTQTPFGLQGSAIAGNRDRDSVDNFLRYWGKFILVPTKPLAIVSDVLVWVYTSAGTYTVVNLTVNYLGGIFAVVFLTPVLVVLLGILVTALVSKSPLLKVMAAIRLLLIIAGVTLAGV